MYIKSLLVEYHVCAVSTTEEINQSPTKTPPGRRAFLVISKFPKIRKIFLSTPVLDVSALFEISKIFKIPEFGEKVPEKKYEGDADAVEAMLAGYTALRKH